VLDATIVASNTLRPLTISTRQNATYHSRETVQTTGASSHAADLNLVPADSSARIIAFDGKALRGSFDNFNDIKAKQVLSAFAVDTALVLAHIEIDEKSNEIPAVQKLLEELDVAGHIVTCDAMHCQKKPSRPPLPRTRI